MMEAGHWAAGGVQNRRRADLAVQLRDRRLSGSSRFADLIPSGPAPCNKTNSRLFRPPSHHPPNPSA